uniref:P/Homo B domain-containing protein n=1 Tax=Scleropages formosus TaxID=113540 RepID=A0A8C9SD15_SCLFO
MDLIWFLIALCSIFAKSHVYTNSWAVLMKGTPENIERLTRKHGFLNFGKVFADDDYYHMMHLRVPRQSLQPHYLYNVRLKKDPEVFFFSQQFRRIRKKRQQNFRLNDPLFKYQWYLSEDFELNVVSAWALGYTGKGVVVSVIDDGIEKSHPDILGNYDPQASYDMNDNDDNPEPRYTLKNENSHGTRCAGQVAAVANNGVCGVGVAFQAKIGGVRMLDGHLTDLIEAKSLNFNQQHIDIYSASWGPEDNGKIVDGPSFLTQEAFIRGINNGRGGLGSIYVWASGNGGINYDNCNLDGYVNSIYTLSVSSATERGTVPVYSEPCSAILTTTYSGGSLHHRKTVTTDLRHSCTSSHTGTSASAPLAAGIIALALEANPTLTWRDVQHITVRASRPANLRVNDWHINGAGRPVSHYYGFGLLDAGMFVDLARKWKPVRPQRKCLIDVITRPLELHGDLVLKWNVTACLRTRNWISSLEHIQARLTLSYIRRGDLIIVLMSPSGTPSVLTTVRPLDKSHKGYTNWAFMSTHAWDEEPSGEWALKIVNIRGILSKFQLQLYGTEENMRGRRTERAVVQQCSVLNSDGTCKGRKLQQVHTDSIRLCQPCHKSCQTCFGPWENNCLDCPPYSTLDLQLGTCSAVVYPWDHRGKIMDDVKQSTTMLGILVGGLLSLICLCWVLMWIASRVIRSRTAARNQVSQSGYASEVRDIEMATFNLEETQSA